MKQIVLFFVLIATHTFAQTDSIRHDVLTNMDVNIDGIANDSIPVITRQFLTNSADIVLSKSIASFDSATTIKPFDWAIGVDCFVGCGFFTKGLYDYFGAHLPVGMAFDVCYKKFNAYLLYNIGWGLTRKDIVSGNNTWSEGSLYNVFLPELSLGYTLLDKKSFKLSPFAGLVLCGINPTEVDLDLTPDLSSAQIGYIPAGIIGMNVDLKFGVDSDDELNYLFLRVRYACQITHLEKRYDYLAGNLHSLTVGIGLFFNGF